MVRRFILVLVALFAPATFTQADTVYFTSKTTGGIYTFDTANSAAGISQLAAPGSFSSPSALALGPDGHLYVGDATDGGRIARFHLTDKTVSTVVSLAAGGDPVSPASIAFRPTAQGGHMLVGRNPASMQNGYPTGPVVRVSGWEIGSTPTVQAYTSGTSLDYSPGLAVAADGTLYASNSYYNFLSGAMNGNVLRFDSSGVYATEVTADGSASNGLFGPAGLAVSGSSLYVASTMNGSIFKTNLLDPSTATNTSFFAMTPVDPVSSYPDFIGPMAAMSNGGLLVGGVANSGLIYSFDALGALSTTFGDPSFGAIGGIVTVPEPGAIALAAIGICGVGCGVLRRRRRQIA